MAGIQGQNQLQDFARALQRRRWQIGVPALLVTTFGACFAVIVPKKYKLSTRIEINETRVESDARLRNPQEMAAKREAVNAMEHVVNYNRVKEIVERNPGLWPEYVQADEPGKQDVLKTILKDLWAYNHDDKKKQAVGSTFVDIQFSDPQPARAAKFLEDLAADWLQDVFDQDSDQLRHERDSMKELGDEAQKRFDEVSDKFYRLAKSLGQDPNRLLSEGSRGREEPSDWSFKARDQAKTEQAGILAQLSSARGELEVRKERLQAEPGEISTMALVHGVDLGAEIAKRQVAVAKLELQLGDIKPSHSRWKRLSQEIVKQRTEIQQLEDGQRGESTVERPLPNPKKQEYLLKVQEQEDVVKRLEGQRDYWDGEVLRLEEETRARTVRYQDLFAQQNELEGARTYLNEKQYALLLKDSSISILRDSPRPWKIAQPPVATDASVQPNPWFLAAFAVAAGLALGVGLAVLSEYARSSYRTVSDLASVMNVPVLGAIQTIVTRRQRRRRQASRALAALSTAVIVGGMSWITWMWVSAPERLPVEVQDAIEQLRSALK